MLLAGEEQRVPSSSRFCSPGASKCVREGEPHISIETAERAREMCLSLVSASPLSHLGHYVGYRLPFVYAKYGSAVRACL